MTCSWTVVVAAHLARVHPRRVLTIMAHKQCISPCNVSRRRTLLWARASDGTIVPSSSKLPVSQAISLVKSVKVTVSLCGEHRRCSTYWHRED